MSVSNEYWAGFFDGEGSVQPERYRSKIHNEKFIVGIKVIVTQKEPMVLCLMEKQFGGRVFVRSVKTPNGVRTSIGRWQCGKAPEVLNFLKAIQPFVLIKSIEIGIAIELIEAIMKPRDTEFSTDTQGRKWIQRKSPIDLVEIKRRQMLEQKFYSDRYGKAQASQN